jgi:hypothetical protein
MILPLVMDHAFASGPVFKMPRGLFKALQETKGIREARLLLAVWRQFVQGG